MGLFSNAQKSNPTIIVEGIEIEFHRDHEWWGFNYRDTEFASYELSLTLPSKAELDIILNTLEALKPELLSRLKKGLNEWCGEQSKLNDGESYSVDVNLFASEKTFTVTWSDGESWGDMGVDYTIKGGSIIDESWGD